MWLIVWGCVIFCWFQFLPMAIFMKDYAKNFSATVLALLILVTIIVLVIHISVVVIKSRNEKNLQELMMDDTFSQIDNIKPFEFERWVARFMRVQGYNAYATKRTGDFGVDVIAEKNNWKIGIQVKKHKKPVGIKAVQEIVSGMRYYNCDEGWVISTAPYFTNSAKKLADMHHVKLIDKKELANYFHKVKKQYAIDKEERDYEK